MRGRWTMWIVINAALVLLALAVIGRYLSRR
jgi:hypothetical protein